MANKIFNEFVGKNVKVPYIDGKNIKIARGLLDGIGNGFVKIRGSLGLIIINMNNIQKITYGQRNEVGDERKCKKEILV